MDGYPNEYAQVVLNLIINAKEALVERKIAMPMIMVEVDVSADGKTCVRVSDNAGGIDEKVYESLFEPYVSTKTTSGSGLGLYMAKMIIEQNMGGKLTARNTLEGALFSIEV